MSNRLSEMLCSITIPHSLRCRTFVKKAECILDETRLNRSGSTGAGRRQEFDILKHLHERRNGCLFGGKPHYQTSIDRTALRRVRGENTMSQRWPTEVRLSKDRKVLTVGFDDGETFLLTAEYLRVQSPSAEVRGHSPAERKIVSGKKRVEIMSVEPVGNYAIKLTFDDMHSTGIYEWRYLYELGAEFDDKWAAYLAELEENGLSRDPKSLS